MNTHWRSIRQQENSLLSLAESIQVDSAVSSCFEKVNYWFSHDVTNSNYKTIDPSEILLSRCIRAAEN